MRCDTNFEVLMAYLDGELEPLERGRVAEHIVACEECRRTVNDLRAVSGALTKWVAPEPASLPTASELLERAGIARPAPAAAAPPQGNARRWLAAAALLLVSGVVGLVAINQFSTDKPTETAGRRQTESAPPPPAATTQPAAPPAGTLGAPAPPGDTGSATTAAAPAAPEQPAEADKQVAQPATTDADGLARSDPAAKPDSNVAADAPPPPPAAAEPAPVATGGYVAPPPKPVPADERTRDAEAEEKKAEDAGPGRRAKVARSQANELQIRSGSVTLSVADASRAIGEIEAAARAASGSTSGQGSAVRRGGKTQRIITVRVPSDRFDETFARIRGIGAASGEHKSSKDIADRLEVTDDAKERESLVDQTRTATIRVTVVANDN